MARTGARTGAGPVAMAGWHGRKAAAMAGLLEKKITGDVAAIGESVDF